MIKHIDSIVNSHKGKPGYVIGLGPSLKNDLTFLENIDRESNCVISCNNVDIMTNIIPHYWMIANNLPEFRVHNNSDRFNKIKESCLVYCYRADGSDYTSTKPGVYDRDRLAIEEKIMSIDFIPFHDSLTIDNESAKSFNVPEVGTKTLHELYCDCVGGNLMDPVERGASLTTVAIHMLKTAMIAGCNPITITGVDLDYTKGYVNNSPSKGNFQAYSRRELGMVLMNGGNEREKTLRYLDLINEDAKRNGVKIYSAIPEGYINSVFEYKPISQ